MVTNKKVNKAKTGGKVILTIALVILTAELLNIASDVVSYLNRGYDLQTAVRWEIDDINWAWARMFPEQPKEKTWYPIANQNIDWNWQFKGER